MSAFCLKLKMGKVLSQSVFACAETCERAGEILRGLHEMQRGPAATENH